MISAIKSANTLIPELPRPTPFPALGLLQRHHRPSLPLKSLSFDLKTSLLPAKFSTLDVISLGRQSGSILPRAPDPLPAKNASPTTTKHDTSSESGSGEGTQEETSTSTTRSASSTGLVTMTITKEVLPTAVTLVFQVGASPTGTTIVLGSVSTASQPAATATSVPVSLPASQPFPSPSSNPAQLANLEYHSTDSHPSNSAPLIAGIVVGVVGLALVAFAIFITMALRRRRKERELLNMMAPSQLQNPFFHLMQSDPRQSFTWVGPIDKPSSRRGSRLAL